MKASKIQEVQKLKISRKFLVIILILPFLIGTWGCASHRYVDEKKVVYQGNKIIPENILEEAKVALANYPELKDVEIEFRYKKDIKKAFMQAQPKFGGLFKGKKNRGYNVFMSSKLLIEDEEFYMDEVPFEVLVGWLSHELGHIMDYLDKSAMELVNFGAKYVTSEKFVKKAERIADTYAIDHGLGNYIFATKDFILNHSDLSDAYKQRKARLYLSPYEILVLVNNFELEKELEEIEEEES